MHATNRPRYARRALTRTELIVTILIVAVVVCLLTCAGAAGIMLPALAKARASARQIKCGTQVRNVVQAMTIHAQGSKDLYPLPSQLDPNNQTTSVVGRAKDTSDNIQSILCFNAMISPELLYCPSESNSNIRLYDGYKTSNPPSAVNPAKALWDPSLRCDFTTGVAHSSYAMLMPSGDIDADPKSAERGRLKHWSNTFNAEEAVFGNRGPNVTGVDAAGNINYDRNSNTMLIHGGRTTWEGNIGYNDNHVNFETQLAPRGLYYKVAGGKKGDVLFLDEPDDAAAINTVLGIWVNAGAKPSEFKGIHD